MASDIGAQSFDNVTIVDNDNPPIVFINGPSAQGPLIAATNGVAAELSTTGGTSDGRFIADICPQLVEFGPVNASIHKIDECIPVADLEPLARIYELCFERLLTP